MNVSFIPTNCSPILPLLVNGKPEQVNEVRAKEILRLPSFVKIPTLAQLMHTPTHVPAYTRGASHGSMHSMGMVHEHDEDAGADADIGSNSTSCDSIDSVR